MYYMNKNILIYLLLYLYKLVCFLFLSKKWFQFQIHLNQIKICIELPNSYDNKIWINWLSKISINQ